MKIYEIQGHYRGNTWAGATAASGLPRRSKPRSSPPPTYPEGFTSISVADTKRIRAGCRVDILQIICRSTLHQA